MITRKVDKNDHLAGFTYGWVKKIGKNVDSLSVICLGKGDISDLPENVKVYSLGKETGVNRFGRFWEFQKLALKLVPRANGIFCHMNPEYTIAIWPYAKLFHKKIISWYTHKSITWKVKLMVKMANLILTASKESFRFPTKKMVITGHGIDIDLFRPSESRSKNSGMFKILSVGRISPTKDYESLIKAVSILKQRGVANIAVEIIGEPGLTEQFSYQESLRQMVAQLELNDNIIFLGPVPNVEVIKNYQQADLFINLSHTGSVDKTVLEAMASGCLVLTSNIAFKDIIGEDFMVKENNPDNLAEKIKWLMDFPASEKSEIKKYFRQIVVVNHNLYVLAAKIVGFFDHHLN